MKRPNVGGIIWATRRDLTGCYVTVTTGDPDGIRIGFGDGGHSELLADPPLTEPNPPIPPRTFTLRLSRGEARLLAKRMNQCLDATVKR